MPAANPVTEDRSRVDHGTKGTNGINRTNNLANGAMGHPGDLDTGSAHYVKGRLGQDVNGSQARPSPIAICGMGLRLPGGIRDADSFWDVLVSGKDTRGPIPVDRYNPLGFNNAMSEKGAIKTQYGYFLDEDLSSLDTSFFTMTQNELEKMDPQQRQALEVTRECLENAGEVNYRGKLIGCYIGTFGEDWLQISAKESQHSGGYIMTGHGDLMIANRISYEYDLQGPSMVIKTGCSASLVGLHEACRALQSGDCTSAIVAGTNLIMGPTTTAEMTQEGILSPEGSCKTFDSAADGFARGEAITAVYIKPLANAIKDGNPIRAVIQNTGTNSDGKSASLMSPNGKSHELLMRMVYQNAGLDPRDTAFVECHGTGTPTGDPIETTAVGNVFGDKETYIGSVKPNVGHSEGASGITSLIKSILTLEHRIIPPNIKFNNANPKIPFAEKKLKVPTEATEWPEDHALRISVNSFGIGGANAVILDSFNNGQGQSNDRSHCVGDTSLLLYSANTQDSLRRLMERYHEYNASHREMLPDVAYTLALRREHLPHRAFAIIGRGATRSVSTLARVPGTVPNIVMVFSGQGAQWAKMGEGLFLEDPLFKEDVECMSDILQSLSFAPDWRIQDEVLKTEQTSRLGSAALAQPLCTAIQIALVNKLARCGVRPKAVIGHSSGEIAAAYASGALSVTASLILAYYRGYVTKQQTKIGGMAAIGLSSTTASTFLLEGVVIACINSPTSVTISGDMNQVQRVITKIKKEYPEVMARTLKVDMAYHSHHMKTLSDDYRRLVEEEFRKKDVHLQDPEIPFISSVTNGEIASAKRLSPRYWESNLTSPVLFDSAVTYALHHQRSPLFLEVGSHSTLAGPIRQIASAAGLTCAYIPTMLRNQDCQQTLLSSFGQMYQQGLPIDLHALVPKGKALPNLPPYPYDHTSSYWYESRVSKDWRFRKYGQHPILGTRVSESSDLVPCWRNILRVEDEPWLYDHKIQHDVVFPFAGYCAMAGEAVRQMTGVENGYSLRHVVAHKALVLTDSKPVEMVTNLRQHQLTDSSTADSWEFVILSHSGSSWVKHCEGRVVPKLKTPSFSTQFEKLIRRVQPSRWYEAMADIGILYGPRFQGLVDITSSTTESMATGVIAVQEEAGFLFHPTAIDVCLQLILVAMAKGIGRNFSKLRIPTMIEELDIASGSPVMHARAWSLSKNDVGVECVDANGNLALRLSGIQLTLLENEEVSSVADKHAGARLEWRPHFDFIDHSKLFTAPKSNVEEIVLQEEMTLLCMIDSAERLKGLQTNQPHFVKFRDWLSREIDRARLGTYPIVGSPARFLELTHASRIGLIEERFEQLVKISDKDAVAIGIKRIWENMEAIFCGQRDTLDILMQENTLTEIYNVVSFGHAGFIQTLSHTKPGLRILEVGAGTGGTTQTFLQDLVDTGGYPKYSLYTFTDISAGFFTQARERFSYAPNMDYKVFDISRSPLEQGFKPQSYDLILAPNVVHATPVLSDTLRNLQLVLAPNGHLVLTELSAVVRTPNYIFGNFSGWWLGDADGRLDEPYISVKRWDHELRTSGFTGVDTAIFDAQEPYQYCAVIVTQPKFAADESLQKKRITVLCDQPDKGVARTLIVSLEEAQYSVSSRTLSDSLSDQEDVISTLDLEDGFFEGVTQARFGAFKDFLRQRKLAKVLWLTTPCQISCKDPSRGQSIGMARTIRSELGIPYFTLEVDTNEEKFSQLVLRIFERVRSSEDGEKLLPDREYAIDHGLVKVGRYHPYPILQELGQVKIKRSRQVKTLEIGKPGLLETLHWVESDGTEDVPEGFVEVGAHAIGLNFRDVVFAMGIISSNSHDVPLGLEITGTVRRINSSKSNLDLGDRVFALAPHGCITTNALLPTSLVVKIPDTMSFEEAATMPICFATAIQSLIEIGQLEKGQSVLIHSAAGGVGHAAIQICQMIGAKVFATAGSEEKIQYLAEKFGIARKCIFNSRNDLFVSGLMSETAGRGVDLVLNSLSGELLHASWRCVAAHGKLIELGKRDLVGFGKLDMSIFLENRSYCCVDVAQLTQDRPEKMRSALIRCLEWYEQGYSKPISPFQVFSAREAEQAFRALQRGNLIGKAVIHFPEDLSEIKCAARTPTLTLDPTASYLLTGGLGGLGKPLVTWLVERGARSLIFLSRSGGQSEKDRTFFKELATSGCTVAAVPGRVEEIADVERAIAMTKKPIKGIIHLAMVLRDAPIVEMTHSDWAAAIAPKVDGAWNLHHALKNHPLDFFLLASSLVTIVDQPGQGNYNASNTFLEALCQYRLSLSLPASVINICPIEGVGFVAENPQARRNMKAQGLYFLGEQEFLDYVALSIFKSQPPSPNVDNERSPWSPWENPNQLIMGLRSELPLQDPNNRTNWRRDRRMAIYHNLSLVSASSPSQSNSNALQLFLTRATDEPNILAQKSSSEYLASEIGKKIFSFMLKPEEEEVDISLSLGQIGLDSLMAIELRRWWKQAFGLEISVLEIMGSGTLKQLGETAAERIEDRLKSLERGH